MDPANGSEAVREALLDVSEGADMIMVKPALAYGDVIAAVKQHTRDVAGDELDVDLLRELLERRFVARADATAQRGERDGAVHRAGVDVRNVERARDEFARRRLADTRRAIDRDDQ